MIKSSAVSQMKFTDPSGLLTKDYNKLGPKVEEIPALLDPDLSIDEAKRRHQASTKNHSNQLFLTETSPTSI